MQVFDASSTLFAWDNYPIAQFPKLWEWIGDLVIRGEIVFSVVAFTEIGHKSPDCCAWLDQHGAQKLPVTNAIVAAALAIQAALGIANGDYGTGVDENDIFVIATAKVHNCTLISDEAVQAVPPLNLKKSKIPLVCSMPVASVSCKNFVAFFKASGAVFG
jgi:predicted nucleic acid-binding protein